MAKKGIRAKRSRKYTPKGMRVVDNAPLFTNNIKSWRGRRVLTQGELADALGVSRVTISNWENGVRLPDNHHKVALCKALGCEMNDLFNWEV